MKRPTLPPISVMISRLLCFLTGLWLPQSRFSCSNCHLVCLRAVLAAFCLGATAHAAETAELPGGATGVTNAIVVVAPIRRHLLTFGLDRIKLLQVEVLHNPLWEYLASLIYILLAFYAAKVLDYVIQVQLKKWAARTATRFDDLLLNLLHGPVKLITFVVLLHIGLRMLAWPEWAANFISNGLKLTVACSLTYVGIKIVDLLMGLWQQRAESAHEGMLDMQLFPIIRKTLKIFVTVVAVLVTSQNMGMNVTGLLASVSIGGLAVGLAAQD